jgi:hypothetical protein
MKIPWEISVPKLAGNEIFFPVCFHLRAVKPDKLVEYGSGLVVGTLGNPGAS